MMEYIRLTDSEAYADDTMPCEYYYEVNTRDDRLQERSIEVFPSGCIRRVTKAEYEADVIELVPIPTVDELNTGIWSEQQHAELISEAQFEALWCQALPS